MRHFLIVLIALGSNYQLIGQKLRPGFIVTLEGDTVRGFLINGTDAELSSKITFKSSNSDNDNIEYRSSDLLSFGFHNGRHFKRFSITKNPTDADSTFVFAKRKVEGKINLYTYSKLKENNPNIFLENNSSGRTFYLTEPRKVSATNNNGTYRAGESVKHVGLIRIAKGDSVFNDEIKKLKYSEKAIQNDIIKYNKMFDNTFPVFKYQPENNYFYNLTVGHLVDSRNSGDVNFRFAFYRNKYYPEKSRKLSIISGISYSYWYKMATPSSIKSLQNYRQQRLSIIPFGISFESDTKTIKPYVYIGVGLGVLMNTDMYFENSLAIEKKHEFIIFPTMNAAGGIKIKIGSDFIIAEVTPSIDGIYMNLGYSF